MRITDTHYFFYMHEFGQWTKMKMTDNEGITYNCCEQYMMYQKAKLFNDDDSAKKIMETDNPKSQKTFGREVKNFDPYIWDANKERIVFDGNYLKFTQNERFKRRLLDTKDLTLVEASPVDKIWGIGLHFSDDRCLVDTNWDGKNLLGKALMAVRFKLSIIKDDTGFVNLTDNL